MIGQSTRALVTAVGLLASVHSAAPGAMTPGQQVAATPPASGEATGRIEVVVVDPTGALVPAAVVEFRPQNEDAWTPLPMTSDRWAAAVPPGSYQLRIMAQGFRPSARAASHWPRSIDMMPPRKISA